MRERFLIVAKYTWKNFGISINDLEYSKTLEDFFIFEDMMLMEEDYRNAITADLKPPSNNNKQSNW